MRTLAWLVALMLAVPGAVLCALSATTAYIVLKGLLTGVLVRPILMEAPGWLSIERASNPDRYWSNSEAWGSAALFFGLLGLALVTPLALRVTRLVRPW